MNRIKQLREEFNFTQQELADKLGLKGKSSIAMYENGSRKPSFKILNQLTELFSCSADYLMGKTNYRELVNYETVEFSKNNILEALEIARTTTTSLKNNTIIIDVTGLTDDDIEDIKELARSKRERRKKK